MTIAYWLAGGVSVDKRQTVLVVILTLLLSLAFASTVFKVVAADPIPEWFVQVNSPQNDKIYPSNTVEVNFVVTPNSELAYSSFTYSIDGQAAKPTNGNTVLTDLPSGSHTLTIYGTGNWSTTQVFSDTPVAVIYFSTVYSTAWVELSAISVAAIAAIGLFLFWKHKQIAARFKGEKTGSFWGGLTLFLLFTALFIPSAWGITYNALFPRYSFGMITSPQLVDAFLVIILVFMAVGVLLMVHGSKPNR